ncbi:MAG: hypothetical protein WD904_02590 [Dehalococcoidia bacterium]
MIAGERPKKGALMQVLFRLAYGLTVAIFYILVVIFGQRTLFSKPYYPGGFSSPTLNVFCDEDDCFDKGVKLDPADDGEVSDAEFNYVIIFREYQDDVDNYSRNVFIFAAILGVIAVAAGIYLYRQVEGLPLGLVLGGLGAIIYGWVESSRDEGDLDSTYAFIAAIIGFAIVVAAGYWFLGGRPEKVQRLRWNLPSPQSPD